MKILIAVGALVSWAALLSYFFLVVDWPALRDLGWPNVLVGVVGAVLAIAGIAGLLRNECAASGPEVEAALRR